MAGSGKRIAYSESEDISIVHFVVQSGQLAYLSGNAVWKEAAEQKTEPKRSWQSLKNRFWKNIVPNIDRYRLLKDDQRRQIQRSCGSGARRRVSDADSIASKSSTSEAALCNPYLCFLLQKERTDRAASRRDSRSDSRESPEADQESEDTSSTASAEDVAQYRKYTAAEDRAIVQYILKQIRWCTGDQIRLRGLQFWTEMAGETQNQRSCQSLRERFLKRILPRLSDLTTRPQDAAAIQKHAVSSKA